MTLTDVQKLHIHLKARNLAERSLVSYYTPDKDFHDEAMQNNIDELLEYLKEEGITR